jgi:RNA polymerase sigma-70 factor, ECF subfamily
MRLTYRDFEKMQDPDLDLVHEAQAGNKAAFGKLVDRHHGLVYAAVFGVLGNREEALDATQDIFVKVFGQIGKFEGQSKFKTWLYRISINQAIDAYRRRRPQEPIEPDAPFQSKGPSPREHASKQETAAIVREALDSLSPDHRAVLVMREWEDLSYEEIADTLNIEIGTVMSRIFYARKRLEKILGATVLGQKIKT